MRELIERLESRHLRESEVWVDENGWAHDDEGNKWKVGSGAPSGVYKGTTFRSGRSYAAYRNQGQGVLGPADKSADRPAPSQAEGMIARVEKVLKRVPNNSFLTSILDQLKRGRSLSEKQVAALEKFEGGPKFPATTATAKPTEAAPPKAEPSTAAAGQSGASNERLDAIDGLLARHPGDRFYTSLRDQVSRGRVLSDKQKAALASALRRAGRHDRAKLFEQCESLFF